MRMKPYEILQCVYPIKMAWKSRGKGAYIRQILTQKCLSMRIFKYMRGLTGFDLPRNRVSAASSLLSCRIYHILTPPGPTKVI